MYTYPASDGDVGADRVQVPAPKISPGFALFGQAYPTALVATGAANNPAHSDCDSEVSSGDSASSPSSSGLSAF